ncbi:MAG TPA: hypothetical protein VMC84_01590 [Methanocella sp.]|uniref:hypothetical protein n=1 Tax=Methanocella sp. TaxID=2052833 RepID=UPI002CC0254A|nr:hypothetical protein [Methanocella sp.]HTY89846.1 hypothetical protein [Methanocella sp.]
MTVNKGHKKPAPKQAPLFGQKPEEHLDPAEENLSLIIDKRSYDRFIKVIALRIYTDFEKKLRDSGVQRPELSLVGYDLTKTTTESDIRMANYIALNARIILDKAFADPREFASRYMPRVMHESADGDLAGHMESKVQHDIMMEIRSIAMQHIPEDERFGYRHKFKVL